MHVHAVYICTYVADTEDSNGTAVAVGQGDNCAAGGILSHGGLPALLDPPSSAHPVGLRKDPPRPPWVYGSHRLRHVIQPLGWEPLPFHPRLGWPSHCAMPHHHAMALVLHPPNRGHQHAQRVINLIMPTPSLYMRCLPPHAWPTACWNLQLPLPIQPFQVDSLLRRRRIPWLSSLRRRAQSEQLCSSFHLLWLYIQDRQSKLMISYM